MILFILLDLPLFQIQGFYRWIRVQVMTLEAQTKDAITLDLQIHHVKAMEFAFHLTQLTADLMHRKFQVPFPC